MFVASGQLTMIKIQKKMGRKEWIVQLHLIRINTTLYVIHTHLKPTHINT